jgi:hypothetical protein
MVQLKQRANNTSPGDALVCEDESGRAALVAGARGGAPFPLARLTAAQGTLFLLCHTAPSML